VRRRVLAVFVGAGCLVVAADTPLSTVALRCRRLRGGVVKVVSRNVYLQEFGWSSPATLKAMGATAADVGPDGELLLFFGEGSLDREYDRKERRLK
jgi:hypothetical protein